MGDVKKISAYFRAVGPKVAQLNRLRDIGMQAEEAIERKRIADNAAFEKANEQKALNKQRRISNRLRENSGNASVVTEIQGVINHATVTVRDDRDDLHLLIDTDDDDDDGHFRPVPYNNPHTHSTRPVNWREIVRHNNVYGLKSTIMVYAAVFDRFKLGTIKKYLKRWKLDFDNNISDDTIKIREMRQPNCGHAVDMALKRECETQMALGLVVDNSTLRRALIVQLEISNQMHLITEEGK